MTDPQVQTETDGHIRTRSDSHVLAICIDRPQKLNAFSLKMLRELAEAFEQLEHNVDLRCGVLYGEGANFSAGLQLDQVGPHMAAGHQLFPPGMVDPMSLREPLRTKPMVAAVQGICFTIGIELMLACDIVIAGADCRFAQIEVKRGIMPTGGATMRFVERAGWGNAQRYLLTGDEFGAEEAFRLGLVQEIVAPQEAGARATAIAHAIAEQAPLAVQASLASSRRYLANGPVGMGEEMDRTQQILARTSDAVEGMRSFLERRKGKFEGK